MRRHCLLSYRRPHSARRAWLLVALVLAGLVALPAAATATIAERLGAGMPLVLKDGRIANVTVHTIPFATGADALDPATAASMEATFRPLATDCFLTAQAIGHVAPGITRDGDTLAAHRLARARADGIQGLLASFGMPQPAVASVWDWQFLEQESQVTLWVFSLNVGDDCDGTPLPIEAPALSAETETPTEAQIEAQTQALARDAAATPPAVQSTADAAPSSDLSRPATEAQLVDPNADGSPIAATAPAVSAKANLDAAPDDPATATDVGQRPQEPAERPAAAAQDPLATAAVGPATVTRSAANEAGVTSGSANGAATATTEAEAPATAAPATLVAAVDADATPPEIEAVAPELVITFDVNSSFFPAGAGPELRSFLDRLPEAEPVQLELAAAVGSGAVRGASAEEAERYNAWMAERRVQRVTEWLEANAPDRAITLTERLVENDPSREVRVHVTLQR